MRTGILFDIHGNIDAFRASIKVLADADNIVHGGDLIGWGTEPSKVIEAVRKHGIKGISGNHELLVRGIYTEDNPGRNISTEWTRNTLSEKDLSFISTLPSFLEERGFCIFHALPRKNACTSEADFPYLSTKEEFDCFVDDISAISSSLILLGHVHIPACYKFCINSRKTDRLKLPYDLDGYKIFYNESTSKTIVVGGSLGWPRLGKDVFVLFVDDEEMSVTFRKVPYNINTYLYSMENKTLKYPPELREIFLKNISRQ